MPNHQSVATSNARCEDVRVTKAFALARLSPAQGVNVAIAGGVVLALAAVCWVPHLPDSLWLDETLTFWVVRDGLAETLEYSSDNVWYKSTIIRRYFLQH